MLIGMKLLFHIIIIEESQINTVEIEKTPVEFLFSVIKMIERRLIEVPIGSQVDDSDRPFLLVLMFSFLMDW